VLLGDPYFSRALLLFSSFSEWDLGSKPVLGPDEVAAAETLQIKGLGRLKEHRECSRVYMA
jgi:hypothetical protein